MYFLFGISEITNENVAYIGQAGARKNGEGILYCLQEHKRNPDKDYWTEAIVFTTSNNSFGPTEISYLENRFCKLATDSKRYSVKNGNDPSSGHITEEKESELEEFIDYAKIVMGTLGHNIFEALAVQSVIPQIDTDDVIVEPTLFLKTAKATATGRRTSEGFVVFKGSIVSQNPTNSCPDPIRNLRDKFANRIDNNNNTLLEDTLFGSPSTAAGFVTFASANGLIMWISCDGRTLKDLESEKK